MAQLRVPMDYEQKINRSVRDLSTVRSTSIKTGVLYPIYFKKLYPHDSFDLDLSTLLQSNPLAGPLKGSYTLRLSVFFEPDSNLYGWLDNNTRLDTQSLLTRQRHYFDSDMLPTVFLSGEYENLVWRGSFMNYYGLGTGSVLYDLNGDGDPQVTKRRLSADRLLAYLDICRSYYLNRQTDSIPYIYNDAQDITRLNIGTVSAADLDDFFIELRRQNDGIKIAPFMDSTVAQAGLRGYLTSLDNGGLFCAQYEPDMLRNILFNVDTSKVNVVTSQNEQGNWQFSIDTLRFQNKMQRLVDRYDLSGGRFSNWLRTVWGSHPSKRMDIPQFIGTTSVIIDPNTVTSISNTYQGTLDNPSEIGSEIGQLAGNVNQSNYKKKDRNKNFHHHIHVQEPGTLVVIASLVPKVAYCNGIEREVTEQLFADDYKPTLSNLGYQPVPYSDYSLVPAISANRVQAGGLNADDEVGKQIAWMHLLSDVDRVYGEFDTGGTVESWVLTRRFFDVFKWNSDDTDYPQEALQRPRLWPVETRQRLPSYYVDPRDWNYMFAITDGRTDNYYLDVGIDIRAVRPIGKPFMPNLE